MVEVVRAVYENGVLKLKRKLSLPERSEVVVVKPSIRGLIRECGKVEVREDVEEVLRESRERRWE